MSDDPRPLLRRLQSEAAGRSRAAADALRELTQERQGSNDDDEHDPEGVTLSSEWSRLRALSDAAAAELRQVEHALARLDAGTYGVCARCGQDIPLERLEVRPFAELCVPCAEALGR